MSIAVLCPTRGNPAALQQAYASFAETAVLHSSRFVCVVDIDDPMIDAYLDFVRDNPGLGLVTVPRDRMGDMNKALNYAAERYAKMVDIVGFIGDDHRFRTPGWDRFVEEILGPGGFLYGDDLAQSEALPTQVFISSKIVRALGWFGLPGAHHLYLDNTWKTLGDAADCLYYCPDIVVEHMHPAYGKAEWDDNHRRVNDPAIYSHDGQVFVAWQQNQMQADVETVRRAIG